MATDTEIVKGLTAAMFASQLGSNPNAIAEIAKQRQRLYPFFKTAADAMAATATAETAQPGLPILAAGKVVAIYLQPTATITGDAANSFTLTVSSRDAAGGTKTTLGTISALTAGFGTMTAWVRCAFTLTAANLAVVAGGGLTWEIAKNGTGVVVPISAILVVVEDT